MQGAYGISAVYTDSASATTTVTAIVTPRQDGESLSDSHEIRAKLADVYIDADSVTSITFTPRVDTISAGGVTYTVLSRDDGNGAVYRYECERETVNDISLRSRNY